MSKYEPLQLFKHRVKILDRGGLLGHSDNIVTWLNQIFPSDIKFVGRLLQGYRDSFGAWINEVR